MGDLRVSFPKPCSERWDDMRPEGCNRFCDKCEKTIHDLSKLTLEEAEDLARSRREICVRAQVGSGGVVELKPGRSTRRMVAAIGASVGILAASPAAADGAKLGAIKGAVLGACGGSVSATASDGTVYRAKVGINGRYKVKRLPAGSYRVKVDRLPEPEGSGTDLDSIASPRPGADEVVVRPGHTSVLDVPDPNGCIIIGVISIDHSNA
jgi:hypothetical protein